MVNIIKHNDVRKLMEQSKKLAPDINIEDIELVMVKNMVPAKMQVQIAMLLRDTE